MVMVYGHLDSCILFYLRSTVQYVTFVTNQAEMGNRKEPSNQAIYWALKTTTTATFLPHECNLNIFAKVSCIFTSNFELAKVNSSNYSMIQYHLN